LGENRTFQASSATTNERVRRAFEAWERARNGTYDLDRRTLSQREEDLAAITSLPGVAGVVDPADIERLQRAPPVDLADLPRTTLWLLSVASATCGEQFGLDQIADRKIRKDDAFIYSELEEHYHTRYLEAVVQCFGCTIVPRKPPVLTRLVALAMTRAPRFIGDLALYVAEIFGICSFLMLQQEANALFADRPKTLQAVRRLFDRIIVDEVGHIVFLRTRLDARRLWVASRLMPLVARHLLGDVPAAAALFGRERCLEAVRDFNIDELARSLQVDAILHRDETLFASPSPTPAA
jgi:hypothetical protein